MEYKFYKIFCIMYCIFMWFGLFVSSFVDGYHLLKLGILIGATFSVINLKIVNVLAERQIFVKKVNSKN
jgi:hypothetical protein